MGELWKAGAKRLVEQLVEAAHKVASGEQRPLVVSVAKAELERHLEGQGQAAQLMPQAAEFWCKYVSAAKTGTTDELEAQARDMLRRMKLCGLPATQWKRLKADDCEGAQP